MKQISAYILIIALIVATAGGILIIYAVMQSRDNMMQSTTLILNGESQKELNVSLTDFYPGREQGYTLQLKATEDGSYEMQISFSTNDKAELAPFIDVKICVEETLLSEGKLNEYLNGDTLTFDCVIEKSKPVHIHIDYKMDELVGDEAQSKQASFKLLLKGKEK